MCSDKEFAESLRALPQGKYGYYIGRNIAEYLLSKGTKIGIRVYNAWNACKFTVVLRDNIFWLEGCRFNYVHSYLVNFMKKLGFIYLYDEGWFYKVCIGDSVVCIGDLGHVKYEDAYAEGVDAVPSIAQRFGRETKDFTVKVYRKVERGAYVEGVVKCE